MQVETPRLFRTWAQLVEAFVSRRMDASTSLSFQFLRMISPLSWMPIAVMIWGVGDAPIYFLLSFAGIWPIALNTAAGVRALDPRWLMLARSF